ncbi:MAG: ClpXP protease specificity-enhancing factor SspB [Magnetococcus sp. DMHC-1]|nr:hypothetical protein [Magnetococcales bacterium]MBF0155018.1 hypothetical protein [Magnetococcales bacterium]
MIHDQQVGKGEVIRTLLEREGRVMLCVDATCKGVEVPRRFASDTGLRLVLNTKMPQSIEIGLRTVESELRFGGIPHYCIIPYEALWGAFNPDSGQGMLWPEAMPEQLRKGYFAAQNVVGDKQGSSQVTPLGIVPAVQGAAAGEGQAGEGREQRESEERPKLAVIQGCVNPDAAPPPDGKKKSSARNHLRLVK